MFSNSVNSPHDHLSDKHGEQEQAGEKTTTQSLNLVSEQRLRSYMTNISV